MRSNCARTPSQQSGSIRLYSPVRLRISLLFDFICSDTHIQSIRLRTSLSVSYKSVSERTFAHRRTITFFSISVTVPLPLSAHFKCTFRAFICLFCPFQSLRLLHYRLNLSFAKITLKTPQIRRFFLQLVNLVSLLHDLIR